jgi:hypothetical protein
MTAISSLTGHAVATRAPAAKLAARPVDTPQVADIGATAVTLGKADDDAAAYSPAHWSPAPLWERMASDPITSRIAANIDGSRLANRFDGLGAALLAHFRADGSDFSQALIQVPAATSPEQVSESRFHAQAANEVALTVTTRGGTTVTVTLGSDEDRLAVQIAVEGGALSESERTALVNLSEGFQKAIDGLTRMPPKLDMSDLLAFDTQALSSVNLHASVELHDRTRLSVDVLADDKQRTITVAGATGTVKVNVDPTGAALLGSDRQREAALTKYLQQFDQAQRRGQGDAGLMALFKDAFGQVHGSVRSDAPAQANRGFTTDDLGMTTGLADFSASVTETTASPNPMRSDEVDSFVYQVAQQTDVRGDGPLDRRVRQHQESSLKASFHRSLHPDTALLLDESRYSQNYFYEQIDDKASSDMNLAYEKGLLATASLTQTVEQSQRTQKYQTGRLVEDTTTPSPHSRTIDVLALVKAAEAADVADRIDNATQRDKVLADMHDRVMLQADAARLRG